MSLKTIKLKTARDEIKTIILEITPILKISILETTNQTVFTHVLVND